MREFTFGLVSFLGQYGVPFFAALVLSLLCTPVVRRLAVKYKFVSFPKQDRWRKRVVASLGGIAIFTAFIIPYLVFGSHDLLSVGFAFAAFGIFLLGLIDDIVHIKPDTKLIGQIITACVVIMFGASFKITPFPMVNFALTIFWVVAIINAFNLLDNMDGLCAGVASIAALILCAHSIMTSDANTTVLSLILLGSTLGFLRYNFNPAKIFMGDSGSMFLGYVLAWGTLMGAAKEKASLLVTMAIPVLLLIVPIFDTAFVTLARFFNNRPISQGGKDHTSHRLVALGLSERKAVLLLYVISAICGLGVLLYNRILFTHLVILYAVFFIGLFIFGIFLSSEVKVYTGQELNKLKNGKKLNGKVIFSGVIYNKRRIIEVILDFIIITISYITAYVLRFEGILFNLNLNLIAQSLPIVLVTKFVVFYSFGLYRGVWRYVGIYDLIAILKATLVGSMLSVFALFFLFRTAYYSRTVFIIDWFITFLSVSGVRILFRLYKEFFANIRLGGKRVLIFGAGDAGELALREIRQNRALGYKPIGFIDDDEDKLDRVIHGLKVFGTGRALEKLIYKYKIDELLVAVPGSQKRRLSEIYEVCDRLNVPHREVSKIIEIKREVNPEREGT